MKVCFVCQTVFQILSCISYVYYQTEFTNTIIDIYVYRDTRFNMEQIISGLRKTCLFHQVYEYKYKESNKLINMQIIKVFFPTSFIYLLSDNKNRKEISTYDFVYISNMVGVPSAMVFANRNALVRFYDDGLGSYLGNIFVKNISKRGLLAHKLAGHKLSKFRPEVLYVFCKNLCDITVADHIIQMKLPSIEDKDYLNILHKVFNYKNNELYKDKPLVYFTQPYFENLKYKYDTKLQFLDEAIEAILIKYEKLGIVRTHPRQDIKQIGRMLLDNKREMWELICFDQITDYHVLVGNFSTAQVTPKLLYDKEPWIIFTYKLYGEFMDNNSLKERNNFINKLKNTYRNPQKVIVLDNISQLENAIQTALYPSLFYEVNK